MLVLLNGRLVRSGPLAEKQETYVCVQVVGGGVLEWVDGLLSLRGNAMVQQIPESFLCFKFSSHLELTVQHWG